MNLYILWYATAKIAAVWGPVPYEMDECLERTKIFVEDIKEGGRRLQHDVSSWSLSCEFHATPPRLGGPQPPKEHVDE